MYIHVLLGLKAYCLSPLPPFTPGLSKFLSSYTTSVVLGKDVVPRLSVRTLCRLRDDMVAAVKLCKGIIYIYILYIYMYILYIYICIYSIFMGAW